MGYSKYRTILDKLGLQATYRIKRLQLPADRTVALVTYFVHY
jgi:hypothetical protein